MDIGHKGIFLSVNLIDWSQFLAVIRGQLYVWVIGQNGGTLDQMYFSSDNLIDLTQFMAPNIFPFQGS